MFRLLDYSLVMAIQYSEVNKKLVENFCFAVVGQNLLMIPKPNGWFSLLQPAGEVNADDLGNLNSISSQKVVNAYAETNE